MGLEEARMYQSDVHRGRLSGRLRAGGAEHQLLAPPQGHLSPHHSPRCTPLELERALPVRIPTEVGAPCAQLYTTFGTDTYRAHHCPRGTVTDHWARRTPCDSYLKRRQQLLCGSGALMIDAEPCEASVAPYISPFQCRQ